MILIYMYKNMDPEKEPQSVEETKEEKEARLKKEEEEKKALEKLAWDNRDIGV